MSRSTPRPQLPLAAVLLLTAACGFMEGKGEGPPPAAATVVRGAFQVTVAATGELEAVSESPIAVPQVPTGALKVKELAPEGSMVEQGEIILVFDESQLSLELSNQTAAFRSANRKIDRTRIEWGMESGTIETFKEVAELQRDYASEFQLDDAAIYSKLEILEAALDKSSAEERILFADAKLLLKGEYYDIDEGILDVERSQAQGKIDRTRTSLGNLVLAAPIGGMVVYRKNWRGATVTVGDTLWPGNIVLSIVDPTRTVLKVNILEKDAAGVQAGQATEVRVDARADRVFAGAVESVAKLSRPIEQDSPVKYFEAKIALSESDPDLLKPGMKGEARILVADLDDAVTIPRSAVRGTEAETHVLLPGPAGPQQRPVVLGPGDLVRVSVVEGLEGGEKVLLGDRPAGSGVSGAAEAAAPEARGAGGRRRVSRAAAGTGGR